MQRAYDCNLPEEWATYSQINLPLVRTAVEQALPNIMNYLFPSGNMISLRPYQPMPYAKVEAVQNYLEYLIRDKIPLKREGLLTLKDACKLNIGYGIVETEVITPITSFINSIYSDDGNVDVREIGIGEPEEVVTYRYVNWRNVIPMPDGSTPDKTSGVFFLDDVREDTLRDMFAMDKTREVPVYSGSAESIIDYVKNNNLSTAHFPTWHIMNHFADPGATIQSIEDLNMISRLSRNAHGPVRIPILKCYLKREHIWITPDGTIIYHIKDDVQTLQCPIKKASPCPDSDNWFPVGDVESGYDAAMASNIYLNALMDTISLALHPPTIVNRQVVHDGDATFEPYSVIDVFGRVGDAVWHVPPPQLPAYIGGINTTLDEAFASANGQPRELRGQGTAGVMRGGGMAFESLLQTTMARSKLASSILESGWLQDTIQHIFMLSQVLGSGDTFVVQDGMTKDFVEKTITANEIKAKFDVCIRLDDKMRRSPTDRAMDLQLYPLLKQDPSVDQDALKAWLIGDFDLSQRLKASNEVYQAQLQAMQQAAQQAQQQQGGGQNYARQAQQGQQAEMTGE
jgi:hypothetical protein